MANLVVRDRVVWPARLRIRRSDGKHVACWVSSWEEVDLAVDSEHDRARGASLRVTLRWNEAGLACQRGDALISEDCSRKALNQLAEQAESEPSCGGVHDGRVGRAARIRKPT